MGASFCKYGRAQNNQHNLNNINYEIFIDTANLAQIKEAQALGVLDGVTTNPSLMAKEGITGKTTF